MMHVKHRNKIKTTFATSVFSVFNSEDKADLKDDVTRIIMKIRQELNTESYFKKNNCDATENVQEKTIKKCLDFKRALSV